MKHQKIIIMPIIILLFMFFSGFSTNGTYLVCPHRVVSDPAYESSHPHNQYVICSTCGETIYTGSRQTKPHGDGTNGTCSKCGSHSYTGRSCTSRGYCACGASIAPSGHTLSAEQYCDAAHPHAYFKYCAVCNAKVYIGGYATKNHGDGSWGSGTCPDCGTHTYTGQTCTSPGSCVCGASTPAFGHTLDNAVYSDAVHPHAKYRYCNVCTDRVYIGGYTVKNHGDGAWGSGTCPDCGTHTYRETSRQDEHPHKCVIECYCGDISTIYPIVYDCHDCTGNKHTASESAYSTIIFTSIDGGDGVMLGLAAVLDCTVTYHNEYIYPVNIYDSDYAHPPFASMGSYVNATVTCTNLSPDFIPPLFAVAHREAKYYNAANELIDTQILSFGGVTTNIAVHDNRILYYLNQKPAYTVTSAAFGATGYFPLYSYGDYTTLAVTTTFD